MGCPLALKPSNGSGPTATFRDQLTKSALEHSLIKTCTLGWLIPLFTAFHRWCWMSCPPAVLIVCILWHPVPSGKLKLHLASSLLWSTCWVPQTYIFQVVCFIIFPPTVAPKKTSHSHSSKMLVLIKAARPVCLPTASRSAWIQGSSASPFWLPSFFRLL